LGSEASRLGPAVFDTQPVREPAPFSTKIELESEVLAAIGGDDAQHQTAEVGRGANPTDNGRGWTPHEIDGEPHASIDMRGACLAAGHLAIGGPGYPESLMRSSLPIVQCQPLPVQQGFERVNGQVLTDRVGPVYPDERGVQESSTKGG
jgi:hypothetical protein